MPTSDSAVIGIQKDRREFLYQLVGAGVAVASTTLISGCAAASTVVGTLPAVVPSEQWDMSWTSKLGRFKTAYDSPEIQGGAALSFAAAAMQGYEAAMATKDTGFTPVLILRHRASVMTLNDAMWGRLGLGEANKLKDPTTGEDAKRNPFIGYKKDDTHGNVDEDSALDILMNRGAVVMACNNALKGVASRLQKKEPQLTQETALQEIRRHVLPGVFVMPNGIFAVAASQDAGCNYMRVLV